jgi:drug/metabolite transporter (DMT)-like permease
MSGRALALVLTAALVHAGWNALAKRGGTPLCFLWWSVSLASLLFVPVGAAIVVRDGFPAAAIPYVVATIAVHAVYFYALGRALASGELSVVYPIARGLGVGLVPLGALVWLGERLSALGAAGVLLVVLGIAATGLAAPRPGDMAGPERPATAGALHWRGALSRGLSRGWGAGTGWAVATGLTIASYSLVDKVGVGLLHPVPYLALMGLGISILLLPAVRRTGTLRREWTVNWQTIVVAATLNLTSYLLVLFAFRLSKAGYVVAAREVSIVLSVLIGRLWLGETGTARRLAGAILVLAGVACIALAR